MPFASAPRRPKSGTGLQSECRMVGTVHIQPERNLKIGCRDAHRPVGSEDRQHRRRLQVGHSPIGFPFGGESVSFRGLSVRRRLASAQ
jgi:hypothetical protein